MHIPTPVNRIGLDSHSRLILLSDDKLYQADAQLLHFQESRFSLHNIAWIEAVPTPANLKASLRQGYRSNIISIERFLQDLHSGRIMGSWGVYLIDLAALGMLLLAISGLFLWNQQLRKRLEHRMKRIH